MATNDEILQGLATALQTAGIAPDEIVGLFLVAKPMIQHNVLDGQLQVLLASQATDWQTAQVAIDAKQATHDQELAVLKNAQTLQSNTWQQQIDTKRAELAAFEASVRASGGH
jgi:hypothetical protein